MFNVHVASERDLRADKNDRGIRNLKDLEKWKIEKIHFYKNAIHFLKYEISINNDIEYSYEYLLY